jgi:predicted peptidase
MIVSQVPYNAAAAPYMGYLLALPNGYNDPINAGRKWPVVISLHGAGECGNATTELNKVATQGPFYEMAQGHVLPDAIYLAPQARTIPPATQAWFWYQTGKKMAAHATTAYRGDPKRIYLMGYSAGAKNTLNAASWEPTRFAAIVPMCGLYQADPALPAETLRPAMLAAKQAWFFHAFDDASNLLSQTVQWVNGITQGLTGQPGNVLLNYPGAATGKTWTGSFQPQTNTWNWYEGILGSFEGGPKITIYPNGGHGGGWVPTYQSDTMWTWLMAQALP